MARGRTVAAARTVGSASAPTAAPAPVVGSAPAPSISKDGFTISRTEIHRQATISSTIQDVQHTYSEGALTRRRTNKTKKSQAKPKMTEIHRLEYQVVDNYEVVNVRVNIFVMSVYDPRTIGFRMVVL